MVMFWLEGFDDGFHTVHVSVRNLTLTVIYV